MPRDVRPPRARVAARDPRLRLHAILDVDAAARHGLAPLDVARAFLAGGAGLIQVRAKSLAAGAFLALCDSVVRLATPAGTLVIVNDRADLALLSGADGVHVGQDDVPPAAARALLGDTAIVGWSTHSVAQIDAAIAAPVDYIAVGPVFTTRTKDTGYDPVGTALVAAAAARAGDRPVVAIGGITTTSAPAVIGAGAAGVAIIADLLADGDPAARVRACLAAVARV